MSKYIDEEERDIIESLHEGEWDSVLDDGLRKELEQAAHNTSMKEVRIRLPESDLHKIREKAGREGMSCQTFISMLIRQYNEGKLKPQV